MRITNPDDLVVGKIIYIVRVSPNNHADMRIKKYRVATAPYEKQKSSGKWIEVEPLEIQKDIYTIGVNLTENKFTTLIGPQTSPRPGTFWEFSLMDAGVPSNNYNQHQTFDSLEDAKQYVCKFFGIDFSNSKKDLSAAYNRAMGVIGF